MSYVKVAEASDMEDGEARVVNANGKILALYRVSGKYYATTNTCAHQGGPLGEGTLSDKVVMCPWHGWKFNVETGVSPVVPTVKIKTYNVKVEGSNVMVEVD